MVFSSTTFLFIFLPLTFVLYYILSDRLKNILLLLTSLVFYAWGEPIFVFVMLFSIILNYVFARLIDNSKEQPTKKLFVACAVILNLSLLVVFKYTNFIIDNINVLLNVSINAPTITLPIGISFFTFQAMSYIIDVYRDKSMSERNFLNVALYISFFPQLIAGPIVKYHDIAQQIKQRSASSLKIFYGIRRFIVGLSKKLLLANAVGKVADEVFSMQTGELSTLMAWMGALCYALQIYFDFSGYSDMAIGLAKMFGFELKENFNYPYISKSIKEFWRRWHISLSTWFKEYLYIPLGGNRKGILRTCVNMSIVFLCTGIWHGAAWNFVVWGLFNGLFLLLETLNILNPEKWSNPFRHLYSFLIFVVGFTIFRAETMGYAFEFIAKMFTWNTTLASTMKLSSILTPMFIVFSLISVIACFPIVPAIKNSCGTLRLRLKYDRVSMVLTMILAIICILNVSSSTFNPFIYFRF
jgi:alginate O-acetyltransferase complex protein AlgI